MMEVQCNTIAVQKVISVTVKPLTNNPSSTICNPKYQLLSMMSNIYIVLANSATKSQSDDNIVSNLFSKVFDFHFDS